MPAPLNSALSGFRGVIAVILLLPICYPTHKKAPAKAGFQLLRSALIGKYNFFIFEMVTPHVAPSPKHPETLHYTGDGVFHGFRQDHQPSVAVSAGDVVEVKFSAERSSE